MLFWIIATLIALAVAAAIAAPLMRGRRGAGAEVSPDVAIYRDQLAEVDRDLARGAIAPAEAERARTEIARRLLAADSAGPERIAEAPRGASGVVVALAVVAVVGGGLALQAALGRADLGDLPRAARMAEAQARLADLPTQDEAEAAAAAILADVRITPPPDIQATVDNLYASLADDPDNLDTLLLLRDFEAQTSNYPAAADLAADVVRVRGDAATAMDLILQLDLMARATNFVVSAEGLQVLDRVAATSPGHPVVNFYRGLLLSNVGRPDLAFVEWRAIADAADPAFPYQDVVSGSMADLAYLAGVDYTPPPVRGPSAAQMADAAEMDPEARAQMIRGMVQGLSDRLAAQGGTAEEWAQLIGALGVLGETDQARAIWTEAQSVFAGQEAGLDLIRAAARDAGVAE